MIPIILFFDQCYFSTAMSHLPPFFDSFHPLKPISDMLPLYYQMSMVKINSLG